MNIEKEISYTIYEHKNKIDGKKYIGVTKQNPKRRWANGKGYVHNKYFNLAIEKYGWDNFEHNILYTNLNEEIAFLLEEYLINKYDLTNPDKGYNLSKGGIQRGPLRFEKMTEWHRTHKKFGEEAVTSRKVRCIETGDVFGSINEACRWCDSEKVGEVCRGNRKHAGHHPETNELLSWEYAEDDAIVTIVCHELIKNDNKKFNGISKKVICIETGEVFNSETEACNAMGCKRGTIGRACNGIRQTALKKHWKWLEEGE